MSLDRDGVLSKLLVEFVQFRRAEEMSQEEKAEVLGVNMESIRYMDDFDPLRLHAKVTARQLRRYVQTFIQEIKTADDEDMNRERETGRFGRREAL